MIDPRTRLMIEETTIALGAAVSDNHTVGRLLLGADAAQTNLDHDVFEISLLGLRDGTGVAGRG